MAGDVLSMRRKNGSVAVEEWGQEVLGRVQDHSYGRAIVSPGLLSRCCSQLCTNDHVGLGIHGQLIWNNVPAPNQIMS